MRRGTLNAHRQAHLQTRRRARLRPWVGLADSGFTLSYQRQRSISGGIAPPFRFGYLLDALGGGAVPPATNFNSGLGFGANTAMPAGPGLRLTQPSLVTYTSRH